MNVATGCALIAALALACVTACTEPPPPKPQPPPPPPAPAPAPEAPAPKCETLKEACKSTPQTQARIPGLEHVFAPPEGWSYAQLEEATVAQVGDEGAVMALTSFAREGKPTELGKKRLDLVKSLTELVLIEPPAIKTLIKSDQETTIAGMKMQLWERKGAKRGKDSGALLILSAVVAERELFGVGFAAKEDTSGTEAILKALQTIALAEGASEKDEKGGQDDASKDKK